MGGTCNVWPAGGVGAGWECTGLAGGGLVLSAAGGSTQGHVYLCACFVCSEEGFLGRRAGENVLGPIGHWRSIVYCLLLDTLVENSVYHCVPFEFTVP